jgi:hypothetical protein
LFMAQFVSVFFSLQFYCLLQYFILCLNVSHTILKEIFGQY